MVVEVQEIIFAVVIVLQVQEVAIAGGSGTTGNITSMGQAVSIL